MSARAPRDPRERERGPFASSFDFMTIRGIPLGIHWSWLFVFGLISWTLGAHLFPVTYPGLDEQTYWIMAGVATVVFFASILAHELGHALVAQRNRMPIEGITLWLFGGVAKFRSTFPNAGAEFRIAIAGPLISLGAVIGFAAMAWAALRLGWPEAVRGVLDYLARINAIILAFNLVPALPLDGGRVLRSYLWHRQESFEAATASAARAGQIFGMALIAVGVLGLFSGASTGGIWIAVLGWFLLQAAQAEGTHGVVRGLFKGLRVRDVMTPDPETVSAEITVDELLDRAQGPGGHSAYPVTRDGVLDGFVTVRMAGRVPTAARATTRVGEVMLRADEVPTLPGDRDLSDALEELQAGPGRAVVLEDGRPVGIVSMTDVARRLELRRIRGGVQGPRRTTGIAVWVVVGLLIAAAVGYLYRPPVAVVSPGPAVDVVGDISITGARVDEPNGRYLLTSVQLRRPNGLGALYAWVHPDQDLVALSSVVPPGVDFDQFLRRQEEIFRESQLLAAAAAARAVGMRVAISGSGAQVLSVLEGSPAEDVLRRGDAIVAIDGNPVQTAAEVGREIRAQPAGTRFELTLERAGGRQTVAVRSSRLAQDGERVPAIGVVLATRDLDVDLPFEIGFARRDVGGPSAGLAYALAIADLLDAADYAAGRTIAASGTVDLHGNVGPVGGVPQKAKGALDAGASLFLVPDEEVRDARGEGIAIRGVGSIAEALEVLRTTA